MTQIAVVLGSESDRPIVVESGMFDILNKIGVSWELSIISAHRNPEKLNSYCSQAVRQGTLVFIGVASMAAALPGAITAYVRARQPVIGVPLVAEELEGLDSLLSMVRMPPGRPVAVCGIGKSGLKNAAILACQIIATSDPEVKNSLAKFVEETNKPAQISILSSERRGEINEPTGEREKTCRR